MLTQSELKSRFEYHPDGALVRRYGTSGNGNFAGAVIGCQPKTLGNRAHRYTSVKIAGKSYRLHRLIYMYHHGEVPEQLDHINGDLLDNRIENLRAVTHSQNCMNRKMRKNSTSGIKGVHWNSKKEKWVACVGLNYKSYGAGEFDTKEEPAAAVAKLREKLHGEYAKH